MFLWRVVLALALGVASLWMAGLAVHLINTYAPCLICGCLAILFMLLAISFAQDDGRVRGVK
jgi:hypothetical protein